SFIKELGYREELERLAKMHTDFIQFVPTVSRPQDPQNAGWTGQTGRVNNILDEYLAKFGVGKAETMIYACGHPQMIEDVKARFIPLGWKVKEERFWKED
ncbi:MAG: hypothetical protein HY678_12110, partial [Chloroflexi bacterium]|nr:hypothetical protein [Chloroflexota bacterium]